VERKTESRSKRERRSVERDVDVGDAQLVARIGGVCRQRAQMHVEVGEKLPHHRAFGLHQQREGAGRDAVAALTVDVEAEQVVGKRGRVKRVEDLVGRHQTTGQLQRANGSRHPSSRVVVGQRLHVEDARQRFARHLRRRWSFGDARSLAAIGNASESRAAMHVVVRVAVCRAIGGVRLVERRLRVGAATLVVDRNLLTLGRATDLCLHRRNRTLATLKLQHTAETVHAKASMLKKSIDQQNQPHTYPQHKL
jgi:hypothetical protein